MVAPHAGAWIEILILAFQTMSFRSLPTRERGLKYFGFWVSTFLLRVAPHAGAWIEIMKAETMEEKKKVAPHAGAWIEINSSTSP